MCMCACVKCDSLVAGRQRSSDKSAVRNKPVVKLEEQVQMNCQLLWESRRDVQCGSAGRVHTTTDNSRLRSTCTLLQQFSMTCTYHDHYYHDCTVQNFLCARVKCC